MSKFPTTLKTIPESSFHRVKHYLSLNVLVNNLNYAVGDDCKLKKYFVKTLKLNESMLKEWLKKIFY